MEGLTPLVRVAEPAAMLHPEPAQLDRLLDELVDLRAAMIEDARTRLSAYDASYPEGRFTPSAWNLALYLSLRRHDLRPLQTRLAANGLSSLGNSEAHILDTVNRLLQLLSLAAQTPLPPDETAVPVVGFETGERRLAEQTHTIFGSPPAGRGVRIMVTLPREAAGDYHLVRGLLERGMDCARINCAHDDRAIWRATIDHVRRAERETGHRCRVLMDLAGHKIRTGPIRPEQPAVHVKPVKNHLGWITQSAVVILEDDTDTPLGPQPSPPDRLRLGVPTTLLERLAPGDELRFDDARGKARSLQVMYHESQRRWLAHAARSAFITPDTVIEHYDHDGNAIPARGEPYRFRGFAPRETLIRVFEGDPLLLTREQGIGTPPELDDDDEIVAPARIACRCPAIFDTLTVSHSVWIDDGKIGAVVEEINEDGALLRITHAGPAGARIKADKGLNFPDTRLELPPLSDKDLDDLDFIAEYADMVGYSFVQCLGDVSRLIDELKMRDARELPIIAKIETRRAVVNLPDILLGTLGRHPLGVMIARGDLAVELGGERMAEIQEELLWLCEAAHVPVIWATQVLENLAKKGIASRPELTDAAMGERAECVMLNKGRYILRAVSTLADILTRMEAHQYKKRAQLRALHW